MPAKSWQTFGRGHHKWHVIDLSVGRAGEGGTCRGSCVQICEISFRGILSLCKRLHPHFICGWLTLEIFPQKIFYLPHTRLHPRETILLSFSQGIRFYCLLAAAEIALLPLKMWYLIFYGFWRGLVCRNSQPGDLQRTNPRDSPGSSLAGQIKCPI
jgi:hypothetical protein